MSLFSHPWCLWAPYCGFSPNEMPGTPGLEPSPPAPALRPETPPPLHTSVDLLSHLTPPLPRPRQHTHHHVFSVFPPQFLGSPSLGTGATGLDGPHVTLHLVQMECDHPASQPLLSAHHCVALGSLSASPSRRG